MKRRWIKLILYQRREYWISLEMTGYGFQRVCVHLVCAMLAPNHGLGAVVVMGSHSAAKLLTMSTHFKAELGDLLFRDAHAKAGPPRKKRARDDSTRLKSGLVYQSNRLTIEPSEYLTYSPFIRYTTNCS